MFNCQIYRLLEPLKMLAFRISGATQIPFFRLILKVPLLQRPFFAARALLPGLFHTCRLLLACTVDFAGPRRPLRGIRLRLLNQLADKCSLLGHEVFNFQTAFLNTGQCKLPLGRGHRVGHHGRYPGYQVAAFLG